MRSISEFLNSFLDQFQAITKAFKKVFRYLQWMFKNYRTVFNSIDTIATVCKISTATVKRATAFFAELGWICKKKRGYNSNLYFMNHELIDLDLDDPNLFKRQMIPSCSMNDPKMIPYYRDTSDSLNICTTSTRQSTHASQEKVVVPEKIAKFQTLTDDQKQKLAKEFSEYELEEAHNDVKWYHGQGKKIMNLAGLLWSRAKIARNKMMV